MPTDGAEAGGSGRGGAAGGGPGKTGRQESGLDQAVEKLFRKGIAPATERMYAVARRRYWRFCERYGRPPLPVSERGLCQFVAFLAGEGLTLGSIKAYLAGVRQLQVEAGLGDPGLGAMAKLGQVVRGVLRLRAEQGVKQRHRKPRYWKC